MKLTVAIPPDAVLRQHLVTLCARLPQADWIPTQDCFLPVRHLGNVTNVETLDQLDLALLRVATRHLDISLSGLSLEAQGLTDIIYLDVSLTEALTSFRCKIENAVRRSGHPLEKRRFRPRFKIGSADCAMRAETIRWAQQVNMDAQRAMTVDRFCLYENLGDAAHTVWAKCEDYPLLQSFTADLPQSLATPSTQ